MAVGVEGATLGKTGIEVSRLCLGSWQISGWTSSDLTKFGQTVDRAIERGINFIDTAEKYGDGQAEEFLGELLKGRRERVVIATKFWHSDSRPEKIRAALNRSLKRLKTDYIDLYQQHWPPVAPPLQESVNELLKLKVQGKIRAVGVSNWMEPEWQELDDAAKVDCLQPCYNLLWRSIEKNVLPLCRQHNIAVIPYSPLCQGLLTGRFKSFEETPNDWRKHNRLFNKSNFPKVLEVLALLSELAQRYSKPISAVALRWLLDQPGVTAPIVGCSRPQQVDDNLQALGWRLAAEDLSRLAEVSAPLSKNLGAHESMWNFHSRPKTVAS